MTNRRLPKISHKYKICIICEGNEEYYYLNRLISLKVWANKYEFKLVNAGGNGNIVARYQNSYQNDSFELVLVFCDTERKPHEQYKDIKRKINYFHGVETASEEVIIFGNPCTLQIVIKYWSDECLKSPAKAVNAFLIKKYTSVENYKGRLDQIEELMKHIDLNNYLDMRKRVLTREQNDSVIGSSNFGRFIRLFERDDPIWIEEINKRLE